MTFLRGVPGGALAPRLCVPSRAAEVPPPEVLPASRNPPAASAPRGWSGDDGSEEAPRRPPPLPRSRERHRSPQRRQQALRRRPGIHARPLRPRTPRPPRAPQGPRCAPGLPRARGGGAALPAGLPPRDARPAQEAGQSLAGAEGAAESPQGPPQNPSLFPSLQVLSLGAGLDSLYFALKSPGLLPHTLFLEVDFPAVASKKARLIARTEQLKALAGPRNAPLETGAVSFATEDYRLLGVDLSELPSLEKALQGAGLDPEAPTLLLAEVVLTYMDVERSDALVQWAGRHFAQAWFVVYEQIHPGDPFGRVMQNHFGRLNSQLRSLARYPDCQAQRARFLQRGWDRCCVMDMNVFYGHFVSAEEKQRVQALEPFDEFEEWHLKCSHYFILVASKGEDLTPIPAFPEMEDKATHTCNVPRFAGTLAADVCATDLGIAGLRRYGHRSVLVAPGVILTTGGFGDQDGRHCRLTALHALVKHENAWRSGSVCLAEPGEGWDGRLFHTVTLLQAGWAIVLGGRKSPVSPAVELYRLQLLGADGSPARPVVELTRLPCAENLALRRWRHTATEVAYQGEAYLFIYGGCRGPRQSVVTEWCFLCLEDFSCRQIPVEGPLPVSRHSHSACGWAGGVLIAGGLDAAEQPLGTVLFLRPSETGFQWCTVETSPPLVPRYSHTAHVHREKLLLVGGVWFQAPAVPGVAVIDLATGATAEYCTDTALLEWPLMLHNHSSIFLPDEEELLLIGGGGNCFSFGSHLNRHPVHLALGGMLKGS